MILPSLVPAILTVPKADGRLPAVTTSSSRSSISLTGFLALRASSAQAMPSAPVWNLLPKPPPM